MARPSGRYGIMDKSVKLALRKLPSVDELLRSPALAGALVHFGRQAVTAAARDALAAARHGGGAAAERDALIGAALSTLATRAKSGLRPVFNLTGTVLHTNLGRAVLAEAAVEAAIEAMRHAVALEFNLDTGRRGERDDVIRDLVCELTGAEDATVVNNNAAAVLLILNTLSKGRETIVSRGELIEIGGAFRLPEIMSRAGTKLREIGTTNRTHLRDYIEAAGPRTGLILKVHTSNYVIQGFTNEVGIKALAARSRELRVPLVHDLGSGTLVDLGRYGIAHEPTATEAISDGADLISFSGDKLLGGPQAGFIAGRKELIARINRNPIKRALRVDKIRLAALEATLKLYRNPERLAEELRTLRLMTRTREDIAAQAGRVLPALAARLGERFSIDAEACDSQIGSGALPLHRLASVGLAIRPKSPKQGARMLEALATALRTLPVPVIGHIAKRALVLDLRCLEDEGAFITNLDSLGLPSPEA
jgi:L-seryl-tRNA(Ser) seleniumtransferase